MSNRALPLSTTLSSRRRRSDTLRLPSVRFNLTEHLARNSVGVSSRSRVRMIASKTVRKDLRRERDGDEKEKKREHGRAKSSMCTSCLVDTTTYDPRNRYLSL